jgi:hypothetical protein
MILPSVASAAGGSSCPNFLFADQSGQALESWSWTLLGPLLELDVRVAWIGWGLPLGSYERPPEPRPSEPSVWFTVTVAADFMGLDRDRGRAEGATGPH